jgi:hypothetical protein
VILSQTKALLNNVKTTKNNVTASKWRFDSTFLALGEIRFGKPDLQRKT